MSPAAPTVMEVVAAPEVPPPRRARHASAARGTPSHFRVTVEDLPLRRRAMQSLSGTSADCDYGSPDGFPSSRARRSST